MLRQSTSRLKPTTATTTGPLTLQCRFAGKRVQGRKKTSTKPPSAKRLQDAKKNARDVKDLIRGTNPVGAGSVTPATTTPGSTPPTKQQQQQEQLHGIPTNTKTRTWDNSTFLKPGPVISKSKVHPPIAPTAISQVPAAPNTPQSAQIFNPTAQHLQINPTVHAKALQDPILLNQGQTLVLNNDDKPYFKYGLCRTIKLPPNPTEIQQSITKRQQQVQEAKGYNNAKDRIRDHCLRRLQIAVQIYLNRLDTATNSIPTVLTLLHPFEYELATITIAQHAHDNPVPYHVMRPLPQEDVNVLLQHVLLQESRVDHQYNEQHDAQRLVRIATNLERYREMNPNLTNPLADDFNLNYVNFGGEENYVAVDGFTNLRAKGTLYYSTVLYNINKCREAVIHHYYKYKKSLNAASVPQDMHEISKKEITDMEKLIKSPLFSTTMDLFRKMALLLKSQHWIDPNIPTLLCIGAPNVGKSSLVRALSTSKTQVQSYRFTTRKLTMGHLDINGFSCQITDSPGLLPRPDEDRNAMEALTIAAIKHLPMCGIAFVIDPTVQGGVSLQHQLLLRNEIRWRFGKVLGQNWIDVSTKADLWSADYGIKKNTLPMTDLELFTYDDLSVQLFNNENNGVGSAGIEMSPGAHEGGEDGSQGTAEPAPVPAEEPAIQPKKRGRPRKIPEPTILAELVTAATTTSIATKKERGITPHWTLEQSLQDLASTLPAPPSDIIPGLATPSGTPLTTQFPSFNLSTIHLRDVHNEAQNLTLKYRFLKNKKAVKVSKEKAQKQKSVAEAERHRVGGTTYNPNVIDIGDTSQGNSANFEDRFDTLTFDEYEIWWDNLSKPQQKIYLQAINDTDAVTTGISKLLGKMVVKVENQQAEMQFQAVEEQRLEEMDDGIVMKSVMPSWMKEDHL